MREFTNRLIELVEEGILDPVGVVRMCVKYMSEDDVEDMCDCNELTDIMFDSEDEEDELEDEEEDDVEEFDPHTEFEHVNDIWDLLEQCETLDQISDVLDEIPRKFGTWFYDIIGEDVVEVTNQWWDSNQQDMMVESQRFEVEVDR
jgi:hypothetical protein